MLGFRDLFRRTIPVTLSRPVTLAAPLMHFLRATVTRTEEGNYMAQLAGSQSSSVLTTMARANALLILPGDRLEVSAGEQCRALLLSDEPEASQDLVLQ
jgi:molybdopterin molybdotransferase